MSKTRNRYVVLNSKGEYLTPRRATGRHYENRAGWDESIDEARVFSTSGAAKNSARSVGCQNPTIFSVEINLVGEPL